MNQAFFKFFAAFAALAVLTSCSANDNGFEYKGEPKVDTTKTVQRTRKVRKNDYDFKRLRGGAEVYSLTYGGHEYIIYRGSECCSMLHSESCPCKKEKVVSQPKEEL